jgi:indole-3-glycerol phosphate synthase
MPTQPSYRLAQLIAESTQQGECVLAFELSRPSPATTSAELAALAKQYVSVGADVIVVPMDSEDTSTGTADLFTVCQAVKVPVLAKDWIIHPLQIVEVKQAGAAGVLGVIAQVDMQQEHPTPLHRILASKSHDTLPLR